MNEDRIRYVMSGGLVRCPCGTLASLYQLGQEFAFICAHGFQGCGRNFGWAATREEARDLAVEIATRHYHEENT